MELETEYFWSLETVPKDYEVTIRRMKGLLDEAPVINFIKNFGKCIVIDLGIGTGRELEWMDKIESISEIIGIDYSEPMIEFCKNVAKNCKKKVTLIKDDMTSLNSLEKIVKTRKETIIYVCLVNTLGNFLPEDRKKVVTSVKTLMKKYDRLVISMYKTLDKVPINIIPFPSHIQSATNEIKISELIEYALGQMFWEPVFQKYKQNPRFWYDEKENDVAIYVGDRKVFISHRWSKEEIEKLFNDAHLKIENLIEGKLMYIVICKRSD